jgi:branched-chain amino acid transport system substrate-binding protein
MKRIIWISAFCCFILIGQVSNLKAQEKQPNYGKAANEIFPYDKFAKAYKYHFLTPIEFYGAVKNRLPKT